MNDLQLIQSVASTVEAEVVRANGMPSSQQQQFNPTDETAGSMSWNSLYRLTLTKMPDYEADSRELDEWLVDFTREQPHLAGVLSQATSLVANRGWTLTGGRNTVNRTRKILLNADMPEGAVRGYGWRHFITRVATSFYNTNLGGLSELGRTIQPGSTNMVGPLAAIWSADSTKFTLGKKPGTVKYWPPAGDPIIWQNYDFLRLTANPSIEEEFRGLGFCAVLICIEIAKLLVAVHEYDLEQLGARAPKGLLLLRGVRQRMWDDAMRTRAANLEGLERQYFADVAVLASMTEIDATLVALSRLPDMFDRNQVLTHAMYLYALAFGFAPDEFWPVQTGGSLGRNTEAQVGMERATMKGDADFFQMFQQEFQKELPAAGGQDPLVLFRFDERSDRGKQVEAEVAQIWSSVAARLYESGLQQGAGMVDRETALRLLVDKGVLPTEVLEMELEETVATDYGDIRMVRMRNRARRDPGVRRYARLRPSDPIVVYQWPHNREIVLYDSGHDLLRSRVF